MRGRQQQQAGPQRNFDGGQILGSGVANLGRIHGDAGRRCGFRIAAGETGRVQMTSALCAKAAQDGGELEVAEPLARLDPSTAVGLEQGGQVRIAGDDIARSLQIAGESAAGDEAEACKVLGRRDQLFPAQRSVARVQQRHGSGQPGRHGAICRGDGGEHQRIGQAVGVAPNQTGAAAAQADPRRQGDGHGQSHRYGRVGGRAVVAKNVASDHGGIGFVGGDYAGKPFNRDQQAAILFIGAAGQQQAAEARRKSATKPRFSASWATGASLRRRRARRVRFRAKRSCSRVVPPGHNCMEQHAPSASDP